MEWLAQLWSMYFIELSFFWQAFPKTYSSIFGYLGGYALVILGF
jgi:hypothetical protein